MILFCLVQNAIVLAMLLHMPGSCFGTMWNELVLRGVQPYPLSVVELANAHFLEYSVALESDFHHSFSAPSHAMNQVVHWQVPEFGLLKLASPETMEAFAVEALSWIKSREWSLLGIESFCLELVNEIALDSATLDSASTVFDILQIREEDGPCISLAKCLIMSKR
ncbi:hypothetical protein Peur_007850 [Populus x canadensis]